MYRVVVVEDSLLLRKGLIYTTDWHSMDCELIGEASNGVEGRALIEKTAPDIVITDIRMPGMTGIEMMESLHNVVDSQYIIITAYNEFEFARKALKMGAIDFISKPIEDRALELAIRNACKVVEQRREYRKFVERMVDVEDSRIMLFKEYLAGGESVQEHHAKRCVEYIKAQYHQDISAKSVADAMKMSESHLNRVMREATGYSVGEYIQNYRIKQACMLLSDPSAKIYEVASDVGIRDQRYFSIVFKRMVGITPKEFQNKLNRK